MTGNHPEPDFISSLDGLASTGGRWLWKSHLRDGLRARLPGGLALLLVVPALAIAVIGLGWMLGQPWKLPLALVATLCPLPSLLYLGHHLLRLWRRQPGRREGLAVFDETLELKDRLQTADEFLSASDRTPFMAAAIEDAGPAMETARQGTPEWHWGKPWGELRRWTMIPVLAVALLVIGVLLPAASRTGAAPVTPEGTPPGLIGKLPVPPETKPANPARKPIDPPEPKEQRPEERVRKGTKGEPAPAKINENPSSQLAGRDKISIGTSEGGQTSQAASAGRASQSRGMPGSQAPSSLPEEQREPKKKKDPKPGEERESETERKKVEDQSGATAGRGSSGGSSRNPAATDWASKDRTEAADNEEFEQEEEVDDEESESEARGGLQPNLRDRRPPVNRDLSIGFGNQASEDSNGRGGPGDRKKSRGVAGLVLGVPIPDHVKGQPNPGRVKVTQERVQPQGEDMPAAAAADRGRRASPAGHLSERTLDASMRQIVRDFFLQSRASDARASETESSTE